MFHLTIAYSEIKFVTLSIFCICCVCVCIFICSGVRYRQLFRYSAIVLAAVIYSHSLVAATAARRYSFAYFLICSVPHNAKKWEEGVSDRERTLTMVPPSTFHLIKSVSRNFTEHAKKKFTIHYSRVEQNRAHNEREREWLAAHLYANF